MYEKQLFSNKIQAFCLFIQSVSCCKFIQWKTLWSLWHLLFACVVFSFLQLSKDVEGLDLSQKVLILLLHQVWIKCFKNQQISWKLGSSLLLFSFVPGQCLMFSVCCILLYSSWLKTVIYIFPVCKPVTHILTFCLCFWNEVKSQEKLSHLNIFSIPGFFFLQCIDFFKGALWCFYSVMTSMSTFAIWFSSSWCWLFQVMGILKGIKYFLVLRHNNAWHW